MTVYDWLIAIANTPEALHVQIDLKKKTIFYNGRPFVVGNTFLSPFAVIPEGPEIVTAIDGLIVFTGDPYQEIERLYAQFKRSVPSKHDRLDKGNFKAYSGDQLSYQELESNMPRQEARLQLEGFILLMSCAGILQWSIPKHFYWQGKDPDLILYREWIM